MNILTTIRHKIGKWLLKENEWTKAVDQIEDAVKELRSQRKSECILNWHFRFQSPPNQFTCHIKIDKWISARDGGLMLTVPGI